MVPFRSNHWQWALSTPSEDSKVAIVIAGPPDFNSTVSPIWKLIIKHTSVELDCCVQSYFSHCFPQIHFSVTAWSTLRCIHDLFDFEPLPIPWYHRRYHETAAYSIYNSYIIAWLAGAASIPARPLPWANDVADVADWALFLRMYGCEPPLDKTSQ